MGIWEKIIELAQALSPKVSIKNPTINTNIQIGKFDSSKKAVVYNEDKDQILFYKDSMESADYEKLLAYLPELVEEKGSVLENETDELFQQICKFKEENANARELIAFFTGIIPPSDLDALKSSLFMLQEKDDVKRRKYLHEIRLKYGQRGAIIANLTKGGYFHHFLRPMCEKDREEFDKFYPRIIETSFFALFVHRSMNAKQIEENIGAKLIQCQKYGFKFLHIHALGRANCQSVESFLSSETLIHKFYEIKPFYNKHKTAMIVSLDLK